jgi:hypothetical protein
VTSSVTVPVSAPEPSSSPSSITTAIDVSWSQSAAGMNATADSAALTCATVPVTVHTPPPAA